VLPTYRGGEQPHAAGDVETDAARGELTVRTERESILTIGLFSNPRLIAAECVGIGIMAAISYLPALQAVFHTAPLSVADWALLTVFGVLVLLGDEARKWWLRRRTPGRGRAGVGAGRP